MKKMQGMSLLEMLLVIGIGAAIVIASVRYFRLTSRNVRVTHAIQQIKTLTQASYEWLESQRQDDFSDTNGGTAISIQELIDAGLIQDRKINKKDPWAGDITIAPGSDPTNVKITLSNVPKKACKNLARRMDAINKITMPRCNAKKNNYSGEF